MSFLPDIDENGKLVVEETKEESAYKFVYSNLPASKKDKVDGYLHNDKLTMKQALEKVGVSIGCIR